MTDGMSSHPQTLIPPANNTHTYTRTHSKTHSIRSLDPRSRCPSRTHDHHLANTHPHPHLNTGTHKQVSLWDLGLSCCHKTVRSLFSFSFHAHCSSTLARHVLPLYLSLTPHLFTESETRVRLDCLSLDPLLFITSSLLNPRISMSVYMYVQLNPSSRIVRERSVTRPTLSAKDASRTKDPPPPSPGIHSNRDAQSLANSCQIVPMTPNS